MKRLTALRWPIVFGLLLTVSGVASADNHPIRTFTFEDRGPEIARLYRLGLENDPKNIPAFCEALASDNLNVRQAAIAQLVFTHDASAFDAVAAAMKDESSVVRRGAIAVLEKLGDPRAIPLLQEALTLEPPAPRRPAARGRGGYGGGGEGTGLRQEEYFNRMAAALALHRLGSDAGVDTVLAILREPHNKPISQMAIKCVILMDLKQATPDLIKIAGEGELFGEDSPCFFALRALRTMGDPAYAAQIAALAKEKMACPGMFVRMEAINLLGKFGDQSVMPVVRDSIDLRVSREERRATVEAICKLRPPDGAALLVDNYLQPRAVDADTGEVTDRPNVHIFHIAIQGVVDFGDRSVLDRLKALYAQYSKPQDHFAYRLDLAYAIAGLGDAFGLDELHKALGHQDAAVRRVAAKRLGALKRPASMAPLTAALDAETEPATFLAMRSALEALGASGDVLARPVPPSPPAPADTYGKPRYLHCTFDDCTTVESMERFVGLIEELAAQNVRWAPVLYVAALSRHDNEYVTMILQRCFDRGCEIENHSLYHNADGSRLNARTADEVRLDCGGCTNWLHGHIMGCDRIYSWRSGGSSFDRPGDVLLHREDVRALTGETFWARNIRYNWRSVPKAYPDVFAPPYHFLGESPVVSTQVLGDLNWDYDADTVEEGVETFADSLDAWYFGQPDVVFDISGHDWPKSTIPVRVGHEKHWAILSGFLREVLLNRRERYPQLYSMTALEILTIDQKGLTPEEILTQTVHLQDSPEF